MGEKQGGDDDETIASWGEPSPSFLDRTARDFQEFVMGVPELRSRKEQKILHNWLFLFS